MLSVGCRSSACCRRSCAVCSLCRSSAGCRSCAVCRLCRSSAAAGVVLSVDCAGVPLAAGAVLSVYCRSSACCRSCAVCRLCRSSAGYKRENTIPAHSIAAQFISRTCEGRGRRGREGGERLWIYRCPCGMFNVFLCSVVLNVTCIPFNRLTIPSLAYWYL